MTDTAGRRERQRDFERFLTFVDAVVAIALTLLVLPLVEVAGELGPGESVLHLLREHTAELFAFVLSFVVIGRLWFVQHRIMHNVVAHDPVATRFTMVWLFLIVLLPFPTALVAEAGEQATTKVLYIGTMALSSLCLAGVCRAVARNPAVRDSDSAPRTVQSVVTAVVLLVAMALSVTVPVLQYWPLALLFLTDNVLAVWRRARGGNRH